MRCTFLTDHWLKNTAKTVYYLGERLQQKPIKSIMENTNVNSSTRERASKIGTRVSSFLKGTAQSIAEIFTLTRDCRKLFLNGDCNDGKIDCIQFLWADAKNVFFHFCIAPSLLKHVQYLRISIYTPNKNILELITTSEENWYEKLILPKISDYFLGGGITSTLKTLLLLAVIPFHTTNNHCQQVSVQNVVFTHICFTPGNPNPSPSEMKTNENNLIKANYRLKNLNKTNIK